jgi:hypothetical protein
MGSLVYCDCWSIRNIVGNELKLHLGVFDVPYQKAPNGPVPQAKKGKKNKPLKQSGTQTTTGQVATILENKYGVMQGFVDLHKQEIADQLASSMAGAIETVMNGGVASLTPLNTATSKIEKVFKFKYLDSEEISQLGIEGVPTEAALKGVNPRFKLKRGPRRSSFVATGLYQSSFHIWFD